MVFAMQRKGYLGADFTWNPRDGGFLVRSSNHIRRQRHDEESLHDVLHWQGAPWHEMQQSIEMESTTLWFRIAQTLP